MNDHDLPLALDAADVQLDSLQAIADRFLNVMSPGFAQNVSDLANGMYIADMIGDEAIDDQVDSRYVNRLMEAILNSVNLPEPKGSIAVWRTIGELVMDKHNVEMQYPPGLLTGDSLSILKMLSWTLLL